tara:strand:+ start:897 stop:1109 length:213 start_codon:yes stop_codon:yes gene_type:complete
MIKIFYLLLILFFLTNCSVDTKSGVWKNKKESISSKKISDLKFDYELSFNEFKENSIEYGKLSKFPNLDD